MITIIQVLYEEPGTTMITITWDTLLTDNISQPPPKGFTAESQ